jgi:hypothetical protein
MRAILACLVVTSLSGVAVAQNQQPVSFEAVSRAKAGSWAEYTMSMNGKPQTMKMKYSIVEKTDKNMALEIDSQTPMGAILAHMAYESTGPDAWKLVKARMQMGTTAPQDLTAEQMQQGGIKKTDSLGKLVGNESVKTPVGSFQCKHYQQDKQTPMGPAKIDLWISDKAVPTGMVKMADGKGVEFILTATGSDAKAKMDMNAKPAAPAPAPAPTKK